jgi:MFS transporter, OFA family, oxalate/formate antiporter
MPMVAQVLISGWGWRQTWLILGWYTLAVGVVPALLLLVRRPEDMGLDPDPLSPRHETSGVPTQRGPSRAETGRLTGRDEWHFTLHEALRTRALWVLAAFSAVGFMAQAGVSLHQVSHYLHQGLSGPVAALMASIFAGAQVPGGLLWAPLTRRLPVRVVLALAGLTVALGAAGTACAITPIGGVMAAGTLGSGVGGLHLLLRLTWAEYYGRHHLGTIRGVTLPMQLGGQAVGPITAGVVFDVTGEYDLAFIGFACLVAIGSLLVLTAVPPRKAGEPAA